MARVEITPEYIVKAMQSQGVRDALSERAGKIRSVAATLAQQEKTRTQEPRVTSGTRPKGRPYSNVVIADGAAQEWGTSRTERRRILGRAAEAR